jgi:hypothetical protein
MTDGALFTAIDALVERCDGEQGDWSDVLARTAAPPRLRRRAIALALAVLAALLALFATPAFGLRDALVGLIERTVVDFGDAEPAPSAVRYQFEDLALGAPPGMDPQAIAGESRSVGMLRAGGRPRQVWVAPTRRGGFCYIVERSGGGCMRNAGDPRPPLLTAGGAFRVRQGEPVEMTMVSGVVLDDRIERITIEFGDDTEIDVPFLYVTSPIDAGFFAYEVPVARRTEARGPKAVIARGPDATVHREAIFGWDPPPALGNLRAQPTPPRPLAATPPVAPSPPLQQATANGVSVSAGRNGAVAFDLRELDPARVALLRGSSVTYGCYRLIERGGIVSARGYGVTGRFSRRVGLRLFRVGTPLDACEVRGSYGHRWPDRLGSHSAAEIAFTDAAKRYFADRAAARDLALLVRMRDTQRIRRQTGDDLRSALQARYGNGLDELATQRSRPPAAKIGYWIGPSTVVFRRASETGRLFEVVIEDGRIASQNVSPLAFVF